MVNKFKQGDIVWMGFDPSLGHEQKGIRPALVVSNHLLNQTNMYYVCPITSKSHAFPTRIPLDGRTQTFGYVIVDQLCAMDLTARKAIKKEECPADILQEVVLTIQDVTTFTSQS